MAVPIVRGIRDGKFIRVLSSALAGRESVCIRLADKHECLVTPKTPRSLSSGSTLLFSIELFGYTNTQPLAIDAELVKDEPFKQDQKRARVTPTIRFRFTPNAVSVVKFEDHRKSCHYFVYPGDLFRAGVEFSEVDGFIYTHAPDTVWSETNPRTKQSPVFASPPILTCLLTSVHDSIAFETSEDWITPAFDQFMSTGTISSPVFAILLLSVFGTALFTSLWEYDGRLRPSPKEIALFINTKHSIARRAITSFVMQVLDPVRKSLEKEPWDIDALIPVMFPGTPYDVVLQPPTETFFSRSLPDKLFSFDCFAPHLLDLVATRKCYIKGGRLFVWNSQLRLHLIKQLSSTHLGSKLIDRATDKISHFVFNTMARDLARKFGDRHLSGQQRSWLEEFAFTTKIRHAFLEQVSMDTDVNIDTYSLVDRMKVGIETALARANIPPTWRYGKIDIKETREKNIRVSIRLLNLNACISPKCDRPHKAASHMFCVGFGHIESLPTKFAVCSNASGRHKPTPFQMFARIAEISVPKNYLKEPINVFFYN